MWTHSVVNSSIFLSSASCLSPQCCASNTEGTVKYYLDSAADNSWQILGNHHCWLAWVLRQSFWLCHARWATECPILAWCQPSQPASNSKTVYDGVRVINASSSFNVLVSQLCLYLPPPDAAWSVRPVSPAPSTAAAPSPRTTDGTARPAGSNAAWTSEWWRSVSVRSAQM